MSDLNERDRALMDGARQVLDQSAAELDEITAQRLRQIRREALAQPARAHWNWGYAGAATAAMAVMAVVLWPGPQQTDTTVASLEDIELLSANEDIEFYEQIEFYQWLDSDGQAT